MLKVLKVAEFTNNETFLSFLPLSHVLERMGGHYTPFSIGATIYYAENMETIADNMVESSSNYRCLCTKCF